MITQGFVYSNGRPVASLCPDSALLLEAPENPKKTPDLNVVEVEAVLAEVPQTHLINHFLEVHMFLVHKDHLEVVTYLDCQLMSVLSPAIQKVSVKVNLDSRVIKLFNFPLR